MVIINGRQYSRVRFCSFSGGVFPNKCEFFCHLEGKSGTCTAKRLNLLTKNEVDRENPRKASSGYWSLTFRSLPRLKRFAEGRRVRLTGSIGPPKLTSPRSLIGLI